MKVVKKYIPRKNESKSYSKVLTVRGSLSLALGLSDGTPILRH